MLYEVITNITGELLNKDNSLSMISEEKEASDYQDKLQTINEITDRILKEL